MRKLNLTKGKLSAILSQLLEGGTAPAIESEENEEVKLSNAFISERHYITFATHVGTNSHAMEMAAEANAGDPSWKRDPQVLDALNRLYTTAVGEHLPLTKFVDDCCRTIYSEDETLVVSVKLGFFDELASGEATIQKNLAARQMNFPNLSEQELTNGIIYDLICGNDSLIVNGLVPDVSTPGWRAPLDEAKFRMDVLSTRFCMGLGVKMGVTSVSAHQTGLMTNIDHLVGDHKGKLSKAQVDSLFGLKMAIPIYCAAFNAMQQSYMLLVDEYSPASALLEVMRDQMSFVEDFLDKLDSQNRVTNAYLKFKGLPGL